MIFFLISTYIGKHGMIVSVIDGVLSVNGNQERIQTEAGLTDWLIVFQQKNI